MSLSPEDIRAAVIAVVEDLIQDWDLDAPVTGETKMVADLAFESIDIIQLTVALEERFGHRKLGFDQLLMTEGRYVDDLTIDQITAFLAGRV